MPAKWLGPRQGRPRRAGGHAAAERAREDGMVYSRADAVGIAGSFLGEVAQRHRIRRAFLFGSIGWGSPRKYSDIDLALVVEPTAERPEADLPEAFEIFHAAQEFNSALEVVCFTPEEFEDEAAALVRRIKKDGLEIDFAAEGETRLAPAR